MARKNNAGRSPYAVGDNAPADLRLPILWEDECSLEMGESVVHTRTCDIIHYGLKFHFAGKPKFQVFADLNLQSDAEEEDAPFLSADVMVTAPVQPTLADDFFYRIGRDGPAPLCVIEVLSIRSCQQGDKRAKPERYHTLGIPEVILVDVTQEYLRPHFFMYHFRPGNTPIVTFRGGQLTSQLGFGLRVDADGQARVTDSTGRQAYARPEEAQEAVHKLKEETAQRRKVQKARREEAKARKAAEDRVHTLEAELLRWRGEERQQ